MSKHAPGPLFFSWKPTPILLVMAFILFLSSGLAFFLPDKTSAATSSTINFQARLMNASGSIAPDGDYNIEFKLYDTASTGGTAQGACSGACKWLETRIGADKVHVENGYVTVNLGSVTAFGSSTKWDQDLWITMNIGGTGSPTWDGEMSPRLKLTAVPYAFKAGQLSRLAGSFTGTLELASTFLQDSTITLPDPGAATATVCYQTSASCGFVAGTATNFIQAVPTGTVNTIQPTASGVVALTVNGTSDASGATALVVAQSQANDAVNINVTGSTQTNGILVNRTNAGTLGNGITITNTSGTVTNGLSFAGAIGTDINRGSGTLTLQGAGGVSLAASSGNIVVNTGSTVRGTFDNSNNLYLGNGVTAAAPNNFVVSGTGSSTTAVAGGSLTLQGGNATVGNANGGNLTLTGGAGFGTGVRGLVVVNTPTFATASTQNCAVNCTITQANVDSNGAVVVNATVISLTVTLPDPTIATAGRIVYVTAALGSSDFTLSVNGGGTGNQIAMRQNTTATMIWNGSDWTAAGASSSTTLQSAYDSTLTSAGGAEIVLNNSASSDGLTVRNNASNPIIGGILEAQTSIGSNLFSVNNNATEYASNGGAETQGASSSTFPSSTWSAAPAGGTISRYTTAGSNIATGAASVFVDTSTTVNTGVVNTLSTTLTPNLKYRVSYAVRHTSSTASFTTLDTIFSRDGTNTATTPCATGSTATNGQWTRVSCTFTAPSSGITAGNAIFIRHSDGVEHDFYIDNLSVNVSADVSHAADGSVDAALGTNWTAFGAGTTVTLESTNIYDSSGSVKVDTTNNADRGLTNNLSITPSTNTQYLVTFYAKLASGTFTDLRVRYSRNGGTNFASCVDYSTQTLSTAAWTKITCLFTTDGTAATNPDLIIDQPTAPGGTRTFYVDALSVTLNTNNASNVQIGGANEGGPATLFTLDRSSGAPIAANNDAYLGSMYYDTTSGRIQCYEADGWGACGAAPDNIVNLNPEYAGAVLNGGSTPGVGTMSADFCGNGGGLTVNTSLCASGEAKNFYKWTSPQATQQTYSIYVTYQLPATFNGFASDDTVKLTARVDNTTNASVTYEMFKSVGGTLTQCGTGETNVITGGGGAANTWYTYGINGNEATGCSFSSSAASGFVIFKINVKANSNANAYVSTLSFTTTGR